MDRLQDNEPPLFATQGGGLATWSDASQTYVWHELPNWYARAGIQEQIGDPIPGEWSVVPVNASARLMDEDYLELFEILTR